jgi:lipid-A-disaccharide synthase
MLEIFVSAGEASGDHYGAEFMRALRDKLPETHFFGLGGSEMQSAGQERIVRAEDVAYLGITEILRHAPYIYRQFRKLRRSLRQRRPQLAVLIDFPDVNFRLARQCHALGIPVLWLVSPQLWAWKKRRLEWVKRWVTKMLVIFPFEESYYRERGVDAEFIGHPLADLPSPQMTREQFAAANGLDSGREWIGLLPGSRKSEVLHMLPEMLKAARELAASHDYQFLLPVAPTLSPEFVTEMRRLVDKSPGSGTKFSIRFVADARAALFFARASIVASGTATVQAALMGNPFVIVYRMSSLSYGIARRFVTVPYAGMPNLVAGREIVPELLQEAFTASNILDRLTPLLADGPARKKAQSDLLAVRRALVSKADPLQNNTVQADNEVTATAMARAADAALYILKSSS